jgi:hypothetical protein
VASEIPQTQDELQRLLKEQLQFLRTSARLYDEGEHSEAKRLAVSIRVLVHDTKKSKSLLGQLGLKSQDFLDTAIPRIVDSEFTYSGLVYTFLGTGKVEYIPLYSATKDTSTHVEFDTWWLTPIFIDDQRRTINRKELVLGAANRDGGAHVDPSLDSTYADLTRNNSLRELRFDGISWEKMPNVESATLRQITHEILQTLEPGVPPPRPKREDDGYLISGPPIIKVAEPTNPPTFNVGGTAAGRPKKIGRNEPCPCGTKKKYKKCCGK